MKMIRVSLLGILLISLSLFTSCSFTDFVTGGTMIRGSGHVVTESRTVTGISSVTLATVGHLKIDLGDTESLRIEAEDNLLEYIQTDVRNGELVIKTEGTTSLNFTKPVNYYLVVTNLSAVSTLSSGDIEGPDIKAETFSMQVGSSGNITLSSLESNHTEIKILSSGDITTRTMKTGTLSAEILSSGNLEINSLEAETLNLKLFSSGDLNTGVLNAVSLDADLSSSGDIHIGGGSVESQDVRLNSSGNYDARNLECSNATMILNSSGSATILVRDNLKAQLNSSGNLRFGGNPTVDGSMNSSGDLIRLDP